MSSTTTDKNELTAQTNKLTRWQNAVSDWGGDKQTFDMSWGKLMMWIFLLGDTFIFSIFLIGYSAGFSLAVSLGKFKLGSRRAHVFFVVMASTALAVAAFSYGINDRYIHSMGI